MSLDIFYRVEFRRIGRKVIEMQTPWSDSKQAQHLF